jgi:hypothetical protein
MSEEQAEYITDAMEMLGAGYEYQKYQPHGFQSPNFTQVPNDLFLLMGDMDECELKIVLYICRFTFGYHRDSFKISTRKMAAAIGMNTASVAKGAEAAERRGLIERVIDGQNTTEWRAIVSESDSEIESPVYQKLNHHDSKIESQVGLNKDKETIKDINNNQQKPKFVPVGSPEEKQALTIFKDHFGKFHGERELKRWLTVVDLVGMEQAETMASWAEKREIHMDNRPGLMDSLETAAKNWHEKVQPRGPKYANKDKGDRSELMRQLAEA